MLISFIFAQKIGHSEKSQCLKSFCIFGILILLNNYGHLIDVEDNFHFCPKLLGILKIPSCLKRFGQFEKKLPNNIGQIMKVNFFFWCHCRSSQVLSHMKINILGRTTLGQMSCTLKTMTLGQIIIAPSHWTKNFCVFDANIYLK
jgi:hypothetical protein